MMEYSMKKIIKINNGQFPEGRRYDVRSIIGGMEDQRWIYKIIYYNHCRIIGKIDPIGHVSPQWSCIYNDRNILMDGIELSKFHCEKDMGILMTIIF